MANVYEKRPEFPCRAFIDPIGLPVHVYPVQCDLAFGHRGPHRRGWDHQWSEDHAAYPPIAVGRAGQCPSWSGSHQCRLDAGHDPGAEFDAMVHSGGGARWSDPHTHEEWEAWEAMLTLADMGS